MGYVYSGYVYLWTIYGRQKLTYSQYLESPEWQNKKIEYKQNKCEICKSSCQLDLHHLNYETVGDERLEDLATLCKICHRASHLKTSKNQEKYLPSKLATNLLFDRYPVN